MQLLRLNLIQHLLYMISLGYLGSLESLSKLETQYRNNIVRKRTKQKNSLDEHF